MQGNALGATPLEAAQSMPLQVAKSSLTHSPEQSASLLNNNQDAKSEQCLRAMSEFNAVLDVNGQSPEVQDTIKQLLHGEHGHWLSNCLSSHAESQHMEMADFAAFLNNTRAEGILDQDLKHAMAHGRPAVITSPKFLLQHAWPSLAMKTTL